MKIERVYREILYGVLEKKVREFKQIELSKICGLSLSTVNYSLRPLEQMNAIEKTWLYSYRSKENSVILGFY